MSSNDVLMSGPTGKVAIPRLQRPGEPKPSSKQRQRVSRACLACRNHKVKCSGDTPSCKHCEAVGRECLYVMPRRDRMKMQIEQLLESVESDISEIHRAETPFSSTTDVDDPGHADAQDPFDTTALDFLNEDLSRDEQTRATGFVGMNSTVQWLRSIMYDELSGPTALSPLIHDFRNSSSFTFYIDSESIDPDVLVDPNIVPDPDRGELLLGCYATTVHDSFPILHERVIAGFHGYFQANRAGKAAQMNPTWQAILNIVLAIGAKYSHLVQARWAGDAQEHLVFQARARELGFDRQVVTEHPDVSRIQLTGLLSFYYYSIGQINRAWTVMGVGIRMAFALGLHVRNEDPHASPWDRERLVRVWWSLYTLERLLNVVTGRPSAIVDSCCSVPAPTTILEDVSPQSGTDARWQPRSNSSVSPSSPVNRMTFANPGSTASIPPGGPMPKANSIIYFKSTIQIATITQDILVALYSAGTPVRPFGDIQQDIVRFDEDLAGWASTLPVSLNFFIEDQSNDGSVGRLVSERVNLRFLYYSTKILLTKPCLNGLRQAVAGQRVQETFVQRMAAVCVASAKSVVDILPDQPDPQPIYQSGPWWNLVHYWMQAVSIFLLALSSSTPGRAENTEWIDCAKRLLRWIGVMQEPIAIQAYGIGFSTLQSLVGRLGINAAYLYPLAPHRLVQWSGRVGPPAFMPFDPMAAAGSALSNAQFPFIDPALDWMTREYMDTSN